MKSFRFNLQKVLNYRENVEEILLAELAAIRAAYDRELSRLSEITTARDMFHETIKRELAYGDPEYIRRAYHYLQDLSRQVDAQLITVRKLAIEKEEKTAEVLRASQDRKILEKLREYKAAEHKQKTLSEEQKFLDDIAGIKHRKKQTTEKFQGVGNES
ncbi:MAG: flagellar export protein FliJ [Armatimonadota bacterium]|nr:flagellar export protein FliJ [Armatimonadota bacterium]